MVLRSVIFVLVISLGSAIVSGYDALAGRSINSVVAGADQGEQNRSYGALVSEDRDSDGRYVFGDWQMNPALGFTAINSTVGFNAGSTFSYKLISGQALYFEPSFVLTAFSNYVVFNFSAGARYDVTLPDTKLRPFAKFSLGPSFQTSGSVAVFNAFAGLGAIYPVNNRFDLRGELGLTNLDGNAGFQMVAGVAF